MTIALQLATEPPPGASSRTTPWTPEEFIARLRAVGERQYHDKHPLHRQMNAGELKPPQVRGWIANRFYYQQNIPIKDAAIISNCPIREVRRAWLHRITDHDGASGVEGGIEAWLRLGEAAGLQREDLLSQRHVLPAVRFAVDAYVNLARTSPWPIAVASSLTELFAPDLMGERIAAFEQYYPWVADWGLEYFRSRVTRARTDSTEALQLTVTYCNTPSLQDSAVRALATKCEILWSMLDAMALAFSTRTSDGL